MVIIMRFKIMFLVGLLLTSCASETSSYKNRENEDIYIDFASVFGFKSDYYCYFHLDGCEACSYLTPKIENKAREIRKALNLALEKMREEDNLIEEEERFQMLSNLYDLFSDKEDELEEIEFTDTCQENECE